MEKLINEIYSYEQVDYNPKSIKYDFVSKGEKEIPKRVSLTQYQQKDLENFYNLGLTNILINEIGEEKVSDMSRDNNKCDSEKVLKTTLVCALDFLTQFHDAKVIFQGNTNAKQRLYKMAVNSNFDELSEFCHIKGGYINGLEIEVNDSTSEKRPTGSINLKNLVYENYNISESSKYHFITFELKEDKKL